MIGQTIGQCRIISELGRGGMATVYLARHETLDRDVAVKILNSGDPGRFRREARVIARLDHPSIVPVYDFAMHEGMPYLVMKYIDGETLEARLERTQPQLAEALRILGAVVSALDYAHAHGVLHRDIKPSNVMLSGDHVYLTDFGLAKLLGLGDSLATADSFVGTPDYISPEQARSQDLTPASDIYSLGVVAYEIIVGRRPFIADTAFQVIYDHLYTDPPEPRDLNPATPEPVAAALLAALAKEPGARPASASAWFSALTCTQLAGV